MANFKIIICYITSVFLLTAVGCKWGNRLGRPDYVREVQFKLQTCDGDQFFEGKIVIKEPGIFRYVTEGRFKEFPFDSLHGFQMSGGPSLYCWGGGFDNSGSIMSFEASRDTMYSPTDPYKRSISWKCGPDLYCVELEDIYEMKKPEAERDKLHLEFSKSYGWVSMRSADRCFRLIEINGKLISRSPRPIFKKKDIYQ